MASAEDENLYAILGADSSMSMEQLRALYKKLVLLYHPDKAEGKDRDEMVDIFQRVDRAWKTLSDPERRRQYDSQLQARQLSRTLVNDEIELEDMAWHEGERCFYHACRCGGCYSLPADQTSGTRFLQCSHCSLCIQVTADPDARTDQEAIPDQGVTVDRGATWQDAGV